MKKKISTGWLDITNGNVAYRQNQTADVVLVYQTILTHSHSQHSSVSLYFNFDRRAALSSDSCLESRVIRNQRSWNYRNKLQGRDTPCRIIQIRQGDRTPNGPIGELRLWWFLCLAAPDAKIKAMALWCEVRRKCDCVTIQSLVLLHFLPGQAHTD